MYKIQFEPKKFNDIKLGWEGFHCGMNPCTPYADEKGYSNQLSCNALYINAPKRVIYYLGSVENRSVIEPVIPISTNCMISDKRYYKYYDLRETRVYIKKIKEKEWNSGIVVEPLYEDPMVTEYPDPDPYDEEWHENELQKIETAKLYSDDSLGDGQASYMIVNFNVFAYVRMPIDAGVYDIYISKSGLVSNHVIVEVIFSNHKLK